MLWTERVIGVLLIAMAISACTIYLHELEQDRFDQRFYYGTVMQSVQPFAWVFRK